jgi:hypothetical protein
VDPRLEAEGLVATLAAALRSAARAVAIRPFAVPARGTVVRAARPSALRPARAARTLAGLPGRLGPLAPRLEFPITRLAEFAVPLCELTVGASAVFPFAAASRRSLGPFAPRLLIAAFAPSLTARRFRARAPTFSAII